MIQLRYLNEDLYRNNTTKIDTALNKIINVNMFTFTVFTAVIKLNQVKFICKRNAEPSLFVLLFSINLFAFQKNLSQN